MKVYWVLVFVAAVSAKVVPSLKKDVETTIQMIQAEGYTAEDHYVTTSDGYILNLHRIPVGKTGTSNGKVAYLQHGLLASSSDWIMLGPDKALAYILADAGYDVWLGNFRGNTYSRNHTTFNPDSDADFWKFSWHEMGVYDIPAVIDHVLMMTGAEKLYYVGHSMGTTAFYVMGSEKQEYMDKIEFYFSLAPIAFMSHMTSPLLKLIAKWETGIELLLDLIGINEFLPSSGFLSQLTSDICSNSVGEILCENALFALCGFSPDDMNMTLLPTIMEHTPSGASTRELLHYGQSITTGEFRQYDHGSVENLLKYGSTDPPEYDLEKVTAPGYLLYSANDWLAAVVDVEELAGKLGNSKGKTLIDDSNFNHLDFTFGTNATYLVYPTIVQMFEEN